MCTVGCCSKKGLFDMGRIKRTITRNWHPWLARFMQWMKNNSPLFSPLKIHQLT
jgi:hypothetical protein